MAFLTKHWFGLTRSFHTRALLGALAWNVAGAVMPHSAPAAQAQNTSIQQNFSDEAIRRRSVFGVYGRSDWDYANRQGYNRYGFFQDDAYLLQYPRARALGMDATKMQESRYRFAESVDPDWVHWWEIQRHDLMPHTPRPAADQGETVADPSKLPPLPGQSAARQQVAGLFLAGLGDNDPNVQWASAMGCGRLKLAAAVPQLIELTDDVDVQVTCAAWVALGLIDTAQARNHLLSPPDADALTEFQQLGRMHGLGMAKECTPEIEGVLVATVHRNGAPDAVKRAAMLSLKILQAPQAVETAQWALLNDDGAGLADAAVATLAKMNPQAFKQIAKPLTQRLGRMQGLPLYQPYLELPAVSPNPIQQMPKMEAFGYINAVRSQVVLGLDEQAPALRQQVLQQGNNRQIMLSLAETRNNLRDAMLKEQYNNWDGQHWFFRPLPMLALASMGDQRDADTFAQAMDGDLYLMPSLEVAAFAQVFGDDVAAGIKSHFHLMDRARGYAAVSMGLFMREPHGPYDAIPRTNPNRIHPQWVTSNSLSLAGAFENQYDVVSFRCATAVGMGISGQPAVRDKLYQTLVDLKFEEAHPVVVSYGLMALAMLDPTEEQQKYVLLRVQELITQTLLHAPPGSQLKAPQTQGGLLAWRAAMLAINQLPLDKNAQILELMRSSHGRHPWLDEVVVECLGQRGMYDLVDRIATHSQEVEAGAKAFDLWQLASYLDPQPTSKVWQLVENMNHTMPLLGVPNAPQVTIDTPVGIRPLGVVEQMVIPGYFELLKGGARLRDQSLR